MWTDEQRVGLSGGRQLKLLAFLLLGANRAVTADALIDAVWGPERDGALKRLQMAIARLRKALAPMDAKNGRVLRTVSGGYLLAVGPGQLDSEVFADRVADGRRALAEGNPALASELLVAALDLWRGPVLAEVAFEDFAQGEIRRLEELRLDAVEARAQSLLQMRAHAQLIGELESHLARDPTREQLAALLMLALYRSGRQNDALDVYRRTRTRLREELGLEPGPALRTLQAQVLEQAPTLDAWDERSGGPAGPLLADDTEQNDEAAGARRQAAIVPVPATGTIGRERDVAVVCSLLERRDVRIVTLTGPGGVGKTRLAQVVAHAVGSLFPDGVCWIELVGVACPEDVGSTIVRALALTPASGESTAEALRRSLAGKRLLLAIDNFEHLLEAAGLLGELCAGCPGVSILATSREPLNLAAEHRVTVPPLPVPDDSQTIAVAELEAAEASALFLAAAGRRDNQFAITPGDAPAVARICRTLDGLPLALELAAATTRLLTVQELAGRLDRALTDLGTAPRDAPARHRTLHATIDWSYHLLDPEQQSAFVRFAVFAGGATLETAHGVTGASLETLQALTIKSLLDRRQQPDGTARLTMLETIRDYASRELAADPGQGDLHRRHFRHYLGLVELTVPRLKTHDQPMALAVLDAELDNLSAALRWALDTVPALALRLAGLLGDYWAVRRDQEGLRWLEASLDAAGEDGLLEERGQAHLHRAVLLGSRREGAARARAAEEALAAYRRADDHAGMSKALTLLARASLAESYPDAVSGGIRRYADEACHQARLTSDDRLLGEALAALAIAAPEQRGKLLEQASELLAPLGDYRALGTAYSAAAYVALIENRVAEAGEYLAPALNAAEQIDDPSLAAIVWGNIGLARLFADDLDAAVDAFDRHLELCAAHSFHTYAAEGVIGLAAVAAVMQRDELAAELRGVARAMGYPGPAIDKPIDERLDRDYFDTAQKRYGRAAWGRAERIGAKLPYEEGIELALRQSGLAAQRCAKIVAEADNQRPGTPRRSCA